eukprot:scaffold680_cov138-Isochrysis_galbana.AAC.2
MDDSHKAILGHQHGTQRLNGQPDTIQARTTVRNHSHKLIYSAILLRPAPLRAATHALTLHRLDFGPQVGQHLHLANGHANRAPHCLEGLVRPSAASPSSCACCSLPQPAFPAPSLPQLHHQPPCAGPSQP